MKSILNHKTHLTAKVSILAIILLVSIAMPLLTFTASAAATVNISPSSGPNGTAIKVTGSGFGASENASLGNFTIAVDGLSTKASLTPTGLAGSGYLATSVTGALSGYFIIGGAGSLNLLPGAHTIQISDSTNSPPAVSFTIVAPTVTLSPSTGPAGTSVTVTGAGFPNPPTVWSLPGELVVAASFAGSPITVTSSPFGASYFTNTPTTLSSNFIISGTYSGTVSLPSIVSCSVFNLTDAYGNSALTTFTLNTPTVTLSPTSGPVGTLVTATVTGFGPGASFANVKIGNGAVPTTISPLIPATPMVTEQGTSTFQFNVTKSPLTANFAAGSRMITVTDSLGNVASAAFTITAQATVTLGSATVNSGVAYAPAGTTGVATYLSVSGFKASSLLTITSSPGVPAGWITYMPGGYPTVTTDATGSIITPIVSATGTAPPSGVYSMTISDGTNSVTVLLTITSSGNFFVISPNAGASGTTVMLTGFLTSPASSGAISFDGFALSGTTACAANTWPTPPSTVGIFTVPASGSGPHTITTAGISGSATFTNTGAPAIIMVSPSSAAVGTVVTLVGSGFANNLVQSLASFTIDSITVPTTGAAFNNGAMVVTFVVPVFLPGIHIISATDGYFNTATASLTTTVSSITISPTKGAIFNPPSFFSYWTLTGSNFPMNQPITVTFTGISGNLQGWLGGVGLTSTNTNGGILIYWFVIPAAQIVAGAHTITVTAGTASATATFTVVPTVSLTATAVKPGGITSITGGGFAASSALSLLVNGVATSWYNTAVTPATVLTTAPSTDITGTLPTGIGTAVASTTTPGSYNVTVVDAAGNAASVTLTVLGAPAITLAAAQGISGVGTVGITGVGFTPGSRVASAQLLQGSTVVTALTVSTPITVNSTGAIAASVNANFTVPTVPAGVYNVSLTLTLPTENAIATFTILGAPTVTTSVTSAKVGTNVTATVVGIQTVSVATLGITNLLGQGANTFGSTTVSATGANAYNLTTWFIVPSIPGGAYTMLFGDGVRSAFATFTVVPSISLSPATGILKGTIVYVTGAGFATAGTPISVTVNGVLTTIPTGTGTTGTGGTVSTNFVVPLTAVANNTVVVTDISGNNATSYFALTPPTITLTPTTGPAGSTVQLIGNAFTPYSAIVVEVGANIVNTVPSTASPNAAGQFIAYVTIPAALSGNQTITVIDSSNNVATAIFAIGGTSTGIIVDQTALSTTAQTLNSAGQPATSFARGSTVKISFVLDSTVGGGNVLWRVTLQQGTAVYNIATTSASISSTPTTLSFSQLIPTGIAAGTWTASVQIFGSDGVTPLGVATLVFNVT